MRKQIGYMDSLRTSKHRVWSWNISLLKKKLALVQQEQWNWSTILVPFLLIQQQNVSQTLIRVSCMLLKNFNDWCYYLLLMSKYQGMANYFHKKISMVHFHNYMSRTINENGQELKNKVKKLYLSSPELMGLLENENLLVGRPRPSRRTSRPPMLLKWFWALTFWYKVDLRVRKVTKWRDKSVHCSFIFSLLITRNNSARKSLFVRPAEGYGKQNIWTTRFA